MKKGGGNEKMVLRRRRRLGMSRLPFYLYSQYLQRDYREVPSRRFGHRRQTKLPWPLSSPFPTPRDILPTTRPRVES